MCGVGESIDFVSARSSESLCRVNLLYVDIGFV